MLQKSTTYSLYIVSGDVLPYDYDESAKGVSKESRRTSPVLTLLVPTNCSIKCETYLQTLQPPTAYSPHPYTPRQHYANCIYTWYMLSHNEDKQSNCESQAIARKWSEVIPSTKSTSRTTPKNIGTQCTCVIITKWLVSIYGIRQIVVVIIIMDPNRITYVHNNKWVKVSCFVYVIQHFQCPQSSRTCMLSPLCCCLPT